MKNNNEFGIPVRVFEGLNEELWKLKKRALSMKDLEAGNVLYCMGRIMQEILVYIPKVDDKDLESEEEIDD